MTLKNGHLISGRYQIQEYIGTGSFNSVYSVLDQEQGLDRAIKFLGYRDQERFDYLPPEPKPIKNQKKFRRPGLIIGIGGTGVKRLMRAKELIRELDQNYTPHIAIIDLRLDYDNDDDVLKDNSPIVFETDRRDYSHSSFESFCC